MTDELLHTWNRPIFHVDGTVERDLTRDLVRLDIEEDTAGLRTMTARFVAVGPVQGAPFQRQLYLDGRVVDFGREVTVSLGPVDRRRTLFEGRISAIEADLRAARPGEVVVFAEDALMDFRMTRRMRTYEQMTDAGVASAIASEHGLGAAVDAGGPTYDVIQQVNVSDLAFLRERAQLIQAEVWVTDRTLYFQSRTARAAPAVTLIHDRDLLEIQVRADLAHQRTRVKVSGYDARARQVIDEEATSNDVRAEAGPGLTGPQVLERAFGERVSYRVREVALAAEEAREWARAEMLRRSRSFVVATGVTTGTGDLIVGAQLTLEGVGAPFRGGPYHVTRVLHTYDTASGHRTHFEAERPTLNEVA